ncbi:hypothetical protein DH2020_018733 [Rehmannia glutinosa]|uniref:Clustered mitochondria protein N-terminal domain-containing protein n=1 Tax=Rehmannia glutinosa TaxID=99300 RepID=A0ABR0WLQ0_REHGL
MKGISTDKILDVKKLLAVNVETCHLTNYSLSHEVKGQKLNDKVEVVTLKPCLLRMVEEDYADESRSVSTCGGSSTSWRARRASPSRRAAAAAERSLARRKVKSTEHGGGSVDGWGITVAGYSTAPPISGSYDMAAIHPIPKLSDFYEFFSFSHLSPPILHLKRVESEVGETRRDGDYFEMQIKICNGKIIHVMASVKGFYTLGKQFLQSHSLVDLLQQQSLAFCKRNSEKKNDLFCYSFSLVTFHMVSVPIPGSPLCPLSILHHIMCPSQQRMRIGEEMVGVREDWESMIVDHGQQTLQFWQAYLAKLRKRVIRDRKAFLVHNLFLDVAVFKAVSSIQKVIDSSAKAASKFLRVQLCMRVIGDLSITVKSDETDASLKKGS